MELFKTKKSRSAMDLVQITGEDTEHLGRRVIFELILTIAMSVGCWYTYFSMFPNPVNDVVSILLIIVLPAALYFLCRNQIIGRFLVFYVFIITALFFLLFYEQVWNGFMVMANIVVEVLNNQLDAGLIPFEVAGDIAQWGSDTLMALIPVVLLESVAIVYSVYYKEPIIGFVMTAIPVLTGLCLKGAPSVWLLILILVCWTGLLVLSAVARTVSRKKRRPIYIQTNKNSTLPYVFLSICLVILVGYVVAFSGDDYRPPESIDEARSTVIAAEEHLRYDKLNGPETDELSRGDLTKTHPLEYTESVVLELKMERAQAMYLRGFVGGSYEDGKWIEAMEGAYSGEYTGAMEWLASKEFYPWMQQDKLYRMSEKHNFSSVKVRNVNGSSKYLYLPYEAALSGDTAPDNLTYRKDYGAFAKGITGQREYSFKVFNSRMDDYDEAKIASWLAEVKKHPDWDKYAEPEAVYRRYVYDTYLYVPQNEYNSLKTIGADKCIGKTIEYTLHYIRSVFDDGFIYDIEQTSAPEGSDEFKYFVEKSHKGNDMHFATAATLMFRCAGIPARYAEGYYLPPEDIAAYEGDRDVRYDVADSNAHCWVEIYIDEIGWFPVEIIPGFYNMQKQETEKTEEVDKLKEETQKNFEDEVYEDTEQGQKHDDKIEINPLWFALLALILLIILYEVLGRRKINKLLDSFGTVFTDDMVYVMYRYVGKLMSFDKNKIPVNPYDKLENISECYDAVTEISFAEFIRFINKLRFGGVSLTEAEHKKMAGYAVCIGSHVYSKQNRFKKFLMKYIIFYV